YDAGKAREGHRRSKADTTAFDPERLDRCRTHWPAVGGQTASWCLLVFPGVSWCLLVSPGVSSRFLDCVPCDQSFWRCGMPQYWLELSVTAQPEAIEAITEVIGRYTIGGVSIEEPYTLVDDGQVALPMAGAPATVRVYVPADASGEEARARIEEG